MGDVPQYRLYKWVPNWGLPSISVACIQVEVRHIFVTELLRIYGSSIMSFYLVGFSEPRLSRAKASFSYWNAGVFAAWQDCSLSRRVYKLQYFSFR